MDVDPDTEVVVGIDIGGSHIGYVFITHQRHHFLADHHETLDSTHSPEQILDQIVNAVKNVFLRNVGWKLVAAGIGCPGHCKNGVLMAASNLPTFKQVPLAKMLSDALNGIPCVLLNDADAAIAAEVWGNDSKDKYNAYTNVAMITIGTGIGLALILNGQIFRGSNGLIEGGHMIITKSEHGRSCGCGQVGCVETVSSAKMTAKRYLEMKGVDPNFKENGHSFGAKDVFELALNGDEIAIKVLEETTESIAIMCINICRVVDPDVIIFAGGMSRAGEALLKPVESMIHKLTWTVLPTTAKLITASTIDHAGATGAALSADKEYSHRRKESATDHI